MSEYKNQAGTIYVEQDNSNDKPFEVWFEDFCIIGTGNSEREALEDAERHLADINTLVKQALLKADNDATHAATGD